MAQRMATREGTSEYVCPEILPLVRNQLGELHSGEATERDFTTTSLRIESTQRLDRKISFVKTFEHIEHIEHKPEYNKVLDGRDEQKEMDSLPHEEKEMGNVQAELSSVPTDGGYAMDMATQDSDIVDGDLTILSHQPSSLNYQPCDSHPNQEVNEAVTPIDGEDKVVNITTNVEEGHQEVNVISVVTVAPVQCENERVKSVFVLPPSKTVQNTIDPEPLKQKQQDDAKVLYRSNKWQAEFPLGEMVCVKHDKIEYHQTHTIKGCSRTLVYERVKPMDHQVFKKWEQLDCVHCDYVVAYLEDGIFDYIIKELLENEMVKVVRMIDNLLKTTEEDIAKLEMCKHPTATEMSQWNGRMEEQQRLKQLLSDLVMGVNNACDCFHQLGFVSLSLKVNNLFVKFDCNCWASRGCIHGSSGLIVVIKDCGLAYPVYSLVDGTTNSKAMKLLDPMHKYITAERFYDNLDIVVFIVKLLTEISGNQSCKKELNVWMSNIAQANFIDPPVGPVQQLFEEYGVAQNDTIKMIEHLKVAAVRYARLHGEHEV